MRTALARKAAGTIDKRSRKMYYDKDSSSLDKYVVCYLFLHFFKTFMSSRTSLPPAAA